MDVTIAILNYNRSKYLDRSLRSCVEQITNNKKIEIIVIDDNSKDDSLKYLNQFKKQIRIYKNKTNRGVGYCSNLAVKKAKGKYFLRVDSDDYLNKLAVHMLSEILDNNKEISFVYSDHYRVDEMEIRQKIVRLNNLENLLLHGAGIMFRKKDILKVGNYDKKLRGAEDHELIYRLINNKKKSFHLPIPLYRYYIHKKNLTHGQVRNNLIKRLKIK